MQPKGQFCSIASRPGNNHVVLTSGCATDTKSVGSKFANTGLMLSRLRFDKSTALLEESEHGAHKYPRRKTNCLINYRGPQSGKGSSEQSQTALKKG